MAAVASSYASRNPLQARLAAIWATRKIMLRPGPPSQDAQSAERPQHRPAQSGRPPLITEQNAANTMDSSSDQFQPGQGASSGVTVTELRSRALLWLKAKRSPRGHIALYVAVNLMLSVVWWFAGAGSFWPVFPILSWGVGLA